MLVMFLSHLSHGPQPCHGRDDEPVARGLLFPGTRCGATGMDMQVHPLGSSLKPMSEPEYLVPLTDLRLDELTRWHGMDEGNLPPATTLKNLSRDTVAAIRELQQARATIEELRAAMGRAFWAMQFEDVHAILLQALGPPPEDLAA